MAQGDAFVTTPAFRSDLTVEYVDHSGGDRRIARAAWCLPPSKEDPRDNEVGWRRVIKSMLAGKHSGPFEHGELAVYVEAPAVVWWQLTRHRFMSQEVDDLSFNLESGRYKVLDGVFYRPPPDRPCLEPDGFRPMRPVLEADEHATEYAWEGIEVASWEAWSQYLSMTNRGVSREVARLVLPFSVYYAGQISAKPWTWLHFFGLRIKGGTVPSFPQWETEQVARKCAAIFAQRWPITWSLFQK